MRRNGGETHRRKREADKVMVLDAIVTIFVILFLIAIAVMVGDDGKRK